MSARKRIIEFPLFLAFFGAMLTLSLDSHFVIYRTCYTILNNTEVECAKLGSNRKDNRTADLERQVEPYANVIMMFNSVLGAIVPAISCLFIGPWSDKHGRKPVMLIAIFGCICAFFIKFVVSLIPSASPWFLLSQNVPSLLSGGMSTMLMICMCYIIDITSKENVGMRIGFVEIAISVALIVGNGSSSFIFAASGYSTVFLICLLLEICSFFYMLFFIEESKDKDSELKDEKTMFSIGQIKEMITTVSKYRDNRGRTVLYLLIAVSVLHAFIMSHMSLMFPFLRLQFGMTLEKFTLLTSIYACLQIVGTLFGVYVLHKVMGIPESVMLLIAYVNLSVSSCVILFADAEWYLYLSLTLQFLSGVITPMLRALISKTIPNEEVGKIFSFVTSVDSIVALAGIPIFTLIYNSTIETFPSAFYLVLIAGYCAIVVLLMIVGAIIKGQLGRSAKLADSQEKVIQSD